MVAATLNMSRAPARKRRACATDKKKSAAQLARPCARRRPRRRRGALKTRPGRVRLEIAAEMSRGNESFCAFGREPDAIEYRKQVEIGEGQLIVNEVACFGNRIIENADLLAHVDQHGVDCT